jgi:hypothetical protein
VTDADEDGHVADDNTCSAESDLSRDDCDDEEPATYLDAEEVCDGKDNDCGGLDDFAEGAPLGGETLTIWTKPSGESMAQFYAPVWCAGLDQYVVVWGTDQRLSFTSLDVAGEPVVEPKPLLGDGKNHSGMLFASCSEDTLGVVWQNAIASSDGEVAVFWSRSDEDPAGVTMNWTRYAGAQLDETQAEEASWARSPRPATVHPSQRVLVARPRSERRSGRRAHRAAYRGDAQWRFAHRRDIEPERAPGGLASGTERVRGLSETRSVIRQSSLSVRSTNVTSRRRTRSTLRSVRPASAHPGSQLAGSG